MSPSDLEPQPYRPPDPFTEAHDEIDYLRSEAEEEAEKVVAARSFWRELPILVIIALVAAILIKTFLVQAFWIPSGSMEETLQVKDRVLVSKFSYRFGDVEQGDVVVFVDPNGRDIGEPESIFRRALRTIAESVGLSTPESDFIKRVIGVGGDLIEVSQDQVYVNGEAIYEPYRHARSPMGDYGPFTVPQGFVFMMGDNRGNSVDSRVFGPIPESDIVGRAFVIAWPPSRWSGI